MFNEFIVDELKNHGATLVGFADLKAISAELRRNLPFGILIAIALDPQIVNRIPSGPHMDYYNEYRLVSDKLNDLCEYTSTLIIEKGYNAFPQSRRNIKQDEFKRTIKRGSSFGLTEGTCGVCLAVCPYTKQYIKNSHLN